MTALPLPLNLDGATGYGYLVNLVEQYFAAVDNRDMDGILACFNEDAVFTIQSAHAVHAGRDSGIREMFEGLFENYKLWRHIHFRHIADPGNHSIASQFTAEVAEHNGETMLLTNCNFFYLHDGRFQQVFVYMSDGVNVLNLWRGG